MFSVQRRDFGLERLPSAVGQLLINNNDTSATCKGFIIPCHRFKAVIFLLFE